MKNQHGNPFQQNLIWIIIWAKCMVILHFLHSELCFVIREFPSSLTMLIIYLSFISVILLAISSLLLTVLSILVEYALGMIHHILHYISNCCFLQSLTWLLICGTICLLCPFLPSVFVETLDKCFRNVCELDVVFNYSKVVSFVLLIINHIFLISYDKLIQQFSVQHQMNQKLYYDLGKRFLLHIWRLETCCCLLQPASLIC